MPQPLIWTPQLTQDGSYTFFSPQFEESFHSVRGARAEAFAKFADATHLAEQAAQASVKLLDVCYGLGYNTAAALETLWSLNPNCRVELYGLELDASVPRAASVSPLIEIWSAEVQPVLRALAADQIYQSDRLQAQLLIGDARQTIQDLANRGFQADAIFFDPFSPRRCPQLWTVDFLRWVARCLAPTGKLATYSRAAAVRAALMEAGFAIGTIPLSNTPESPSHEWSQGTVASFAAESLPPLSLLEQEHLRTRAAVPYRDPTLADSAEVIRQRQQQEQQQSTLESTSSWRRRWGIR